MNIGWWNLTGGTKNLGQSLVLPLLECPRVRNPLSAGTPSAVPLPFGRIDIPQLCEHGVGPRFYDLLVCH
jgi:hypothetical protein